MSKTTIGEAIQVRGRIYTTDSCFQACNAAPEKKMFQTMLDLANEAISVREFLGRYGAKHKLADMLMGQSSMESISFLMGATHNSSVTQAISDLSDTNSLKKDRSSNNDGDRKTAKPTEVSRTSDGVESGTRNVAIELDDDLLEAFSTFPGARG